MSDLIVRLNAALGGRYHIERQLGEGGMAKVYLADDLRHERKVALKVLKTELAAVVGADRFLAEIKTTANLQHPHILPLFDSGEADGLLFYVMPYVEGESIRERLDREHQLPVDEAVQIAENVAEALDYAHSQGVIHRDIKPANILLQAGKPVVSDFGIALAVDAAGADRLTETGLSVGTPCYMSPEQATGDLNVGARSDVYSLACVLYEMIVGEPPYAGSTPQAILGKIIAGKIASPMEERPSVPPNVDAAIRRALAKVPADRFGRAADFGAALGDTSFRHGDDAGEAPTAIAARWMRATFALVALSAALAVFGLWSLRAGGRAGPEATPESDPIMFVVGSPAESRFGLSPTLPEPALSSDGRLLAFTAPLETPSDRPALAQDAGRVVWVQRLGDLQARPLTGTDGAFLPFWSPDQQFVGFAQGGRLKRIAAAEGGAPQDLSAASGYLGGTWSRRGTIVFAGATGLLQVPSDGGEPRPLTRIDDTRGEYSHRFPVMLADDTRFVYLVMSRQADRQGLYLGSLEDLELKEHVVATDANGALATGRDGRDYLLYIRDFTLLAQPFDLARGEMTGTPAVVARPIEPAMSVRFAAFAASGRTLVYRPRFRPNTRLIWMDRRGIPRETVGVDGQRYSHPDLSPDGTKLAVSRLDRVTDTEDVWWFDLSRLVSERLTTDPVGAYMAAWTPDGGRVIFSSARGGSWRIYARPIDGGDEEPLLTDAAVRLTYVRDVSPDGRSVVFQGRGDAAGSDDLWALPLTGGGEPSPLIETPAAENHASVSPDGRWLAFTSDESGEPEVYVTTFPKPTDRRRISMAGGADPQWRGDGGELYYLAPEGTLMAVDIGLGETLEAGTPAPLFRMSPDPSSLRFGSVYAPAPDGQRFLVVELDGPSEPRLVAMLNWSPDR